MSILSFISALAITATIAVGRPSNSLKPPSPCPPLPGGNFNVSNFKLYPENLDWDPVHCKLYVSGLDNATVLIYDPYTKAQEILSLPGISFEDDAYHLAGVDYDHNTGYMYFAVGTPTPWYTNGRNLTSQNYLICFDTASQKVVYQADLSGEQAFLKNVTGIGSSGFQDMAEDAFGNSYPGFGYGNALAKVSPTGVVTSFYHEQRGQENATQPKLGYSGIVSIGKTQLVVSDFVSGNLLRFDTLAENPQPTVVPIANMPANYTSINCDGLETPVLYEEKVFLCSEDYYGSPLGAITIFHSNDGWKTGTYLGQISNSAIGGSSIGTAPGGGIPVAAVQMVNRFYVIEEFLYDQGYPKGGPANRSSFPFIDITDQVTAIVGHVW